MLRGVIENLRQTASTVREKVEYHVLGIDKEFEELMQEGMEAAWARSQQEPGWEEKGGAWLEKRKAFIKKRGGPTLLDLDE